jgi:putative phage-type endonuclease
VVDLSGASKFDTMPPVTIGTYKSMFPHMAELLRWNDIETPAASYSGTFSSWRELAEDNMDSVINATDVAFTQEEEEGIEAARQIGHGIFQKFLTKARPVGWASQAPDLRRAEVERILSLPQIPQRTPEWYAQGRSVLTASEFGTLFGSPRAIRQLAFQKVPTLEPHQTNRPACMTCEMSPFDWGVRFEPVVKLILKEKWGATIMESGRLLHPTDPLLAASPDGLISEATEPERIGRLVEIKCPITREITGTIPFEYWCQMQLQMEVTGIEECEYVEVKLDSPTQKKPDISGATPDGFVWLFQNPNTARMSYAYTEEERCKMESEHWDLVETIPWRLANMYAKTVARDATWFKSTATMREEFWKIVAQARQGEIQPFEVKSRAKVIVTKEPECRIVDES